MTSLGDPTGPAHWKQLIIVHRVTSGDPPEERLEAAVATNYGSRGKKKKLLSGKKIKL